MAALLRVLPLGHSERDSSSVAPRTLQSTWTSGLGYPSSSQSLTQRLRSRLMRKRRHHMPSLVGKRLGSCKIVSWQGDLQAVVLVRKGSICTHEQCRSSSQGDLGQGSVFCRVQMACSQSELNKRRTTC